MTVNGNQAALLMLFACGSNMTGFPGNPSVPRTLEQVGVDVDALLRPPSQAERADALNEWRSRSLPAEDIREEARFELPNDEVMLIISHASPNGRHLGAIRAPLAALEGGSYPIVVHLAGLAIDPMHVVPDPAASPGTETTPGISLWPAFRGQALHFRDLSWSADGDSWDFCDGSGDDAIAFLNAALEIIPGADDSRVVAVGGSRGGNVGLLMGIRDERIDVVVSLAGPTDFFSNVLIRHHNAYILYERGLFAPLLDGTGSVEEARARLTRCSPRYFADQLPPVQLHHGDQDLNLPLEQMTFLADALSALDRDGDEVFVYEGISHHFEGQERLLKTRIDGFVEPYLSPR